MDQLENAWDEVRDEREEGKPERSRLSILIMTDQWYFGTSCGGVIQGVNSGDSEQFRAKDILSTTVREVIQNSLDAQRDPSKPVRVKFQMEEVRTIDIPGYGDLLSRFKDAQRYWSSKGNNETALSLEERISILQEMKVPILTVSDSNTTGLSGTRSEDIRVGDWNALVRMNGGGTKEGTKNGSKGLGKNAPFALSSLGLVFYSTFNLQKEKAAEGVVHLVNYPKKGSVNADEFYNGTGYFGNGIKPKSEIR